MRARHANVFDSGVLLILAAASAIGAGLFVMQATGTLANAWWAWGLAALVAFGLAYELARGS